MKVMSMRLATRLMTFLFLAAVAGCGAEDTSTKQLPQQSRTFEQKTGSKFIPSRTNIIPDIQQVNLKRAGLLSNSDAIWGATGRDDEGFVYFAVSTHGGPSRNAQLFKLQPDSGQISQQGDVIEQLSRAGLYQDGIGQNKLHSKIVQADDGYLYFTSFDEGGEAEGVNPTWGGHLWRKRADSKDWEHLLHAEHALVAVNTNGRYVYALGYWDHVLYQYDTITQSLSRVTVGSYRQHVSRNFLVDEKGHAFVPKIMDYGDGIPVAYLDEFDIRLRQVESYRLVNYKFKGSGAKHHGIVGYASLANGDLVFTTHEGQLYRLYAARQGKEKLAAYGSIHPQGRAYVPGLFSINGKEHIGAIARGAGITGHDWINYDLEEKEVISVGRLPLRKSRNILLYGSITRDNQGAFYIGGWDNRQALLLKLNYASDQAY